MPQRRLPPLKNISHSLTFSVLLASEVHSCRHLLSLGNETGVQFPDGVYTINPDGKGAVNTYCDMSRDGGGWTLLVTSHTNTWTAKNVRKRNENKPTLSGDFSILYKADFIKDCLSVGGDGFEYRIEANERGKRGPCKACFTLETLGHQHNDVRSTLYRFVCSVNILT